MPCPGRRYSVNAQNAVAASVTTNVVITSTTAIRPVLYYWCIGASGTPADNALQIVFQRTTAAGTTTAVTPQALDPNDPASTATAGKTATIEPTYTANAILWRAALNQRATIQFFADQNGGLMLPATASNGIGMSAVHASFTGNSDWTVHFTE